MIEEEENLPTKYPIHPPFEGNQPAEILDIDKLTVAQLKAKVDRLRGLLEEMVEALEAVCFYGDEEPYDYTAYHKAKSELAEELGDD